MATRDGAQGFDLVGDIHGCALTLRLLLQKLGYCESGGAYRHPTRHAIFVGDVIDRGPRIREALRLVKAMVDAGEGTLIMGNHEYNALCYCTPAATSTPQTPVFLREHSPRHLRLIGDTLEQYRDYPGEWEEMLQWFLTLPLFLELEAFRVVHACWDPELIAQYLQQYGCNHLDEQRLRESVDKTTLPGRLMDRLTRGLDIRLPDGLSVTSRDGFVRHFFRAHFWSQDPQTYNDVVFQPDPLPEAIAHRRMNDDEKARLFHYAEEQKPLFIGHYWRCGQPRTLTANIACLDYSAVKYGKLVAYRMDGEARLCNSKFVWVDVDLQEPGLPERESDADD
ncbi:metallophosphoesterase [Aestuariirhabdus litorea]|uniref:Serine/threonine protein phosphatase n=1 Tax=Aestuariirhabdus litorea TaxID=2528527 RepID=A0A3P3VRL5_9GAMM|nr:metallophosphoesterase [Aestuariirhabdus litorea]RRJ84628.1 serine/threonine protein phosphatase [Aestuariirhabdus litorea]RWW97853.1 serine/threonine protein phosphatase [Endozoicomonadaceae bacterium GTF-13]